MINQKTKSVFSLIITLLLLLLIHNSSILPFLLLPFWLLIYRPFKRPELIMFVIASIFIIGQNYSVLKSGGFTFAQQDFFLMPYYEPFMWGFYYLNMKRFISEDTGKNRPVLRFKSFLGLAATGICFSFFSQSSDSLLISTIISTCILLLFFHKAYDIYYGLYALCLGFIIELFGISTDLWSYPDPDFLGMPFWFATMWISVGILGRRLLIPLSELIDNKLS
jgi:lipoprotein signal peptidase